MLIVEKTQRELCGSNTCVATLVRRVERHNCQSGMGECCAYVASDPFRANVGGGVNDVSNEKGNGWTLPCVTMVNKRRK
jgi:hypothetical protein